MSKKQKDGAIKYSLYLRDYYNKLATGREKMPSDAELSLFLRQLVKNIDSKASKKEEAIESIDEFKIPKRA